MKWSLKPGSIAGIGVVSEAGIKFKRSS